MFQVKIKKNRPTGIGIYHSNAYIKGAASLGSSRRCIV
jgi:hypothetical protein